MGIDLNIFYHYFIEMNRISSSLTDIYNSTSNALKNIKATIWYNQRNYITLLFVLTALVVGIFFYYELS